MPAGALVVRRTGPVHVVADVLLVLYRGDFAVAALLESRLDGAGILLARDRPLGVLLRGPRSLFVWGPLRHPLTALAMYLKPEGALLSLRALGRSYRRVRAAGLLVLLVLAALSFTRSTRARLAHELERASATKSSSLPSSRGSSARPSRASWARRSSSCAG